MCAMMPSSLDKQRDYAAQRAARARRADRIAWIIATALFASFAQAGHATPLDLPALGLVRVEIVPASRDGPDLSSFLGNLRCQPLVVPPEHCSRDDDRHPDCCPSGGSSTSSG